MTIIPTIIVYCLFAVDRMFALIVELFPLNGKMIAEPVLK